MDGAHPPVGRDVEVAAAPCVHAGDRDRAAKVLLRAGEHALRAGLLGGARRRLTLARQAEDDDIQARAGVRLVEALAPRGFVAEATPPGGPATDRGSGQQGPRVR